MELHSIEMALLIAAGFAALSLWFAPMAQKLESKSENNQPSVHPDRLTLADVIENHEPNRSPAVRRRLFTPMAETLTENVQPSVHPDLLTIAPMIESHEPNPSPEEEYDVFLSFRGPDTRRGLVSHLYHELKTVRRIRTFIDDRELELGVPVGETLLKTIEKSHFAVVVLSENYAQSSWCLEELTKICECMKDSKRIIPLFYNVEPTVVRYQTRSFRYAFWNYQIKGWYSPEKIQQWKKALTTVANFSGCDAKEHKTDREVVKHIVEIVCRRVRTIECYRNFPLTGFEKFAATKEAMDKVLEALKNDEVIVVGVDGMAGIGKTTMVEHVAVEAYRQGLFHQWTMAEMSRDPDLWEIQARLASMLGETLESKSKFDRAGELRLKIKGRKRILIILDNVWPDTERDNVRLDIKLLNIGIPSFEELKRCNSKVLLTTRTRGVYSHVQCRVVQVPLDILNETDSWRLFKKNTGMSFEPSTKLHQVASEVAKECAGLPRALETVAKALGGKSLDRWKIAARRLKASETSHPEENKIVFNSIKFSYDSLGADSKLCFLLCCLFPEGYDIQIEDLLRYGIGYGLFEWYNMQDARTSLCDVVQYLKDSNLLLDGKMDRRCVRMHAVIRDVGLSISLSKDGHRQFFVQAGWELHEWPTIDAHECYTAISLMRNNITNLPEVLVFPELQILLLQSSTSNGVMNEIPCCWFERLKALKVLDISCNRISFLPSSSTILTFLTSIHTLCLDDLSKESNISLLGQLKQLKVLSMRQYPHRELPKEIGQLANLKLLDFTSESIEIVPSKVIGKLSKLEELYMQCYFADWGSNAVGAGEEAKACFEELTGLSDLHILKVFISDANIMPPTVSCDPKWKNFDIFIHRDWSVRKCHLESNSTSSPVYSRALTLDISMVTLQKQKWFVDYVVKKTQKLLYIGCRDLCNILSEYNSGRLNKLKYLSVTGPSEKLKELMSFMSITGIPNEPVFQNLEELHLDQLDCLEKLCVGELPTRSLCNLRLLKVRCCHKLMSALESDLLQRLENLEKLSCEEMDELKYVFSSEGPELEQSTLPELKEMRLDNLDNLIKICNGPVSCRIFDHVKILVVLKCIKLKNLFTYDEADHLHNLEDLSIEACPGLERVIEASKETVRNKKVLPKLKKLALKRLSKLTRFYGSTENAAELTRFYGSTENAAADEDEENIEFPLLEHSDVDGCHKFKSPARKKLDSMMRKQHTF